MIRHISVFTFKDGPDKQQNMETVKAYLEKVPTLYPAIKAQTIGTQVADFETLEDANGYPASEAHTKLAEFSTPMLKKVTAIDFVVEGE